MFVRPDISCFRMNSYARHCGAPMSRFLEAHFLGLLEGYRRGRSRHIKTDSRAIVIG